ncbi:MAG: class II aldolase/adducin family protein [Candidatus Saccharibacteria bacterium]
MKDHYTHSGIIVISQFEHGFFAWGRTVDEAFENAYRARRNAQALLLSKLS